MYWLHELLLEEYKFDFATTTVAEQQQFVEQHGMDLSCKIHDDVCVDLWLLHVGEDKLWKFGNNGDGTKDCLTEMVKKMTKMAGYNKPGYFTFHSLRAGL